MCTKSTGSHGRDKFLKYLSIYLDMGIYIHMFMDFVSLDAYKKS